MTLQQIAIIALSSLAVAAISGLVSSPRSEPSGATLAPTMVTA